MPSSPPACLAWALTQIVSSVFGSTLGAQSLTAGPRVIPVFMVPADMTLERRRLELTVRALGMVREWYSRVLRGPTFAYDPPVVQASRHTFAEFAADSFQAWWPLLQAEFKLYGMDWEDDDTKMLWIAHGAGAWAGADSENGGIDSIAEAGKVVDGDMGGLAVIGDSTLGGYLAGICPDSGRTGSAWWCSWYTFQGTIAHELGHTWGLPHPDAFIPGFRCSDSTAWTNMQCHWGFPFDSLLPYEQSHLRSLRYFRYHCEQQWSMLADRPPIAGQARAIRFELGDSLLWMDGFGGGTGFLWGVEVDGGATYSVRPSDDLFAASIGLPRGASREALVQIALDGTVVYERSMRAGDPPLPIVIPLRRHHRVQVIARGMVGLGNARFYPPR